jgi:alpha-L-fucosidase
VDLYFQSVGRGASFLLNLPPDRRGRIHEHDVHALRAFRKALDDTFAVDLARGADHISAHPATVEKGDVRRGPRNAIDGNRDTFWYTGDRVTAPELILEFERPVRFNAVGLREYLPLGQRVEAFALDAWQEDGWHEVATGTSVGNRRLVRCEEVVTTRVRWRATRASVCPALSALSLFTERRSEC